MKIEVPNSLSDFTVRQFQEFKSIEEPNDLDALRIFLGLTEDLVLQLKDSSVEDLLTRITNILASDVNLVRTFKFRGVEYGFEPDLDGCTYGVNKDATTYLGDFNTFHKAIEVLYRPITHKLGMKYSIEPYKGTSALSESFRDLPLDIALGMNVFFYSLMKDLLSSILSYSVEEIQELLSQEDSLGSGDLITKSLRYLTETSLNLMK